MMLHEFSPGLHWPTNSWLVLCHLTQFLTICVQTQQSFILQTSQFTQFVCFVQRKGTMSGISFLGYVEWCTMKIFCLIRATYNVSYFPHEILDSLKASCCCPGIWIPLEWNMLSSCQWPKSTMSWLQLSLTVRKTIKQSCRFLTQNAHCCKST